MQALQGNVYTIRGEIIILQLLYAKHLRIHEGFWVSINNFAKNASIFRIYATLPYMEEIVVYWDSLVLSLYSISHMLLIVPRQLSSALLKVMAAMRLK